MRACPSCGHANADDADFCASCGEYVRWENTQVVSAVTPAVEKEEPPPAQQEQAAAAQPPAPAEAAPPPAQPAPPAAQPPAAQPPAAQPPPPPAPAPPAAQPAPPAPAPAQPAAAPATPAAAPAPAAPAAAPAVAQLPPDEVMLNLRLPTQESATGEPVFTSIEAGGRASVLLFIRNQSRIVENYRLRVEGLPESWWTIVPDTVYLVPYGTGGTYEQEVEVVLHPPRSPEAEARPWNLQLVAHSTAQNAEARSAFATMTILPYLQVETELRPERRGGRRKAKFDLTVANKANARTGVNLVARDDEGLCKFEFGEPELAVDPGQTTTTPLVVRPPRPMWIGRPADRRFQVTAQPLGSDQPVIPRMAAYRQKPWLPWWLAVVVPVIVAAILLLLPHKVKVPDLGKVKGPLAAQQMLIKKGLILNPQIIQQVTPLARPGSIVGQAPKAGATAKRGSQVTIQVALPAAGGAKAVPDLTGQTPGDADRVLREAGMALGAVTPQPPDLKGKIAGQLPSAGTKVKPGTVVNVFEAVPKKGDNGKKVKGKAPKGVIAPPGAAAAAVAGGSIVLPKILGQPAAKATAAISQAKLVPVPITAFATGKPGTAVGTLPDAGSKVAQGAQIKVLISAGYPRLAYAAGGAIVIANGGTGKQIAKITGGSGQGSDPTWSADGRLVFRSGDPGQLFLVSKPGKGAKAQAISDASENLHDPTFAPKGDALAAIKQNNAQGGDGDLCFMRVSGSSKVQPGCIPDPQWNLGNRIAWAPDGKSILVYGNQKPATNALLLYESSQAFSTNPSDWGAGKPVTDITKTGEGAFSAAFAPDGKRVAIVATQGSSFQVAITKVGDWLLAQAKRLPVNACDAAWRPDGGELLVESFLPGCSSQSGFQIARVDPKNPNQVTILVRQGSDPAWESLSLKTAPPSPGQAPSP